MYRLSCDQDSDAGPDEHVAAGEGMADGFASPHRSFRGDAYRFPTSASAGPPDQSEPGVGRTAAEKGVPETLSQDLNRLEEFLAEV